MENVTISTSYASSIADLATTFIWNGGSGTFTLPQVGSINVNWFVKIVNAGSGNLTVTPQTGTIDNASTKAFAPGGTGFVFTDGTNFWSLGYGLSGSAGAFGYINLSLPASGTYTISGAQLNQISYLLTGALTANVTLVVPASVQQYWINNQTTGGFEVIVQSASPGTTVAVAQGSQVILYCDGTNIISAVTGTSLPILVTQGGTGATTAAGARTNLGFSSVGSAIGTAASTGAAQTAMGAGTTGAAVFVSANNVAAWAALVGAGSVVNGMNLGSSLQIVSNSKTMMILSGTGTGELEIPVAVSIFTSSGIPGLQIQSASPTTPTLQIYGTSGVPALMSLTDGQAGNENYVIASGAPSLGSFGIQDNTANSWRLTISNAGQAQLYEPSFNIGSLSNAATLSNGSFTAALTGTTTNPQGTVNWVRVGAMVMLVIPALSGPSNSTSMTMTGLPAALRPAANSYSSQMMAGISSSAQVTNIQVQLTPAGTLTFYLAANSAGFANDGLTKGINFTGQVFTYFLY